MSRPKSMSAKPSRSAADKPSGFLRHRRKWWIGILALAVLPIGLYFAFRENARVYYLQAKDRFPGNPAKAEELAEIAIQAAGGQYPAAQLLQCQALAAMGEWTAVYGGLSLIKDPSQCEPSEWLDLGQRAMSATEWAVAEMSLLAAASRESPSQSRAMELWTQMTVQFQRQAEALAQCQTWQRQFPAAAMPWLLAADLHASGFQLADAIADYREALRRSPDHEVEVRIRSSLVRLLVLTGDRSAAPAEFDWLRKQDALTGPVRLSLAQFLRMEGKTDEGLDEIRTYIDSHGASAESLKLRGMLQLDAGQLEAATEDLTTSVKLNPFDIGAQHMLGQALLQAGKPDRAKPHLEKARRMTEATDRISELESQLKKEPGNLESLRELKVQQAILGR